MRFAIIGAGMSGLACADVLSHAGHDVRLFDKGRGPGGRMSTKRLATPLGDVAFDHGAQYFTARDPGFLAQVESWRQQRVVERWPLVAPDAWIGSPGMNAIVKHMAAAHAVSWGHAITGLARRDRMWRLTGAAGETGPFDAVILAMPAEQAAAILLLHDLALARVALGVRSRPCWTAMFVFDRPLHELPPVVRTGSTIAWATRNSAKPGRSGPEAWVVQANGTWSAANLEQSPDWVSTALHAALADAAGQAIPEPIAAVSHRWRYALSQEAAEAAPWNSEMGLGVCGDWLLGPRVECAWLSGTKLGQDIVGTAAQDGSFSMPSMSLSDSPK